MARNCLNRLPGALEAVTERESVERKNAMVSSSNPTQRVHRSATKYSHIKIVSPKKASTICGASSAPQATTSCKQASTWNTVSPRKEGRLDTGRSARRFSSSSSRSATV